MALSNRVNTTTREFLLRKLVDTVLRGNVLFQKMASKAKDWEGSELEIPVRIAETTTTTAFSGFDDLPTSAVDNNRMMTFEPKFVTNHVALPLSELSINDNALPENKILSLMNTSIATTAMDMADDIGGFMYGDGTTFGGKAPLGLGALVDDGSSVATIGGLSRSTYTSLQSTVTASGGTLTLAKMHALWNAAVHGGDQPTMGLTSKDVYSLYELLLSPQERIYKMADMGSKDLVGGTGFSALEYKGKPVIYDEKCTSGVFFFLNENYLDMYGLPFFGAEVIPVGNGEVIGTDYSSFKKYGFSWGGWKSTENQAALIGRVYWGGEFTTSNPNRHAKLTGITGI